FFAGGPILLGIIVELFQGGDLSANRDSVDRGSGGLRLDQIIPPARSAGFSGTGGFTLQETVLMLPGLSFTVGYARVQAQNAGAGLLGALVAQILAFIVVSIAGIVFPYRLKDVWESAGGRRIMGIPAVTLAGIGGVLVLGGMMIMFIVNPTINATFAVTRRLS